MSVINAQNWPRDKRYRRLVIPRNPGEVLVEADLSQAESMIVAWKAKERTLMNKYRNKDDVHSFVASIVMSKEINKEQNKEERTIAKRIVHGSNYGMQPQKIVEVLIKEMCLAYPLDRAKKAQIAYFQNFPRIRTGYHASIENELRTKNRIVKTPVGLERKFYTPLGPELFRKAYAYYPQTIVAYITNNGINTIARTDFRDSLVMQVHDSIILSVPKEKSEEAAKLLQLVLTYPLFIEGEELIIPVDVSIGENWGAMKEDWIVTGKHLK